MANKTRQQLEDEIELSKVIQAERVRNDKSYAPMIIKTIVYGACALFLTAMITALVGLVIKQ